MLHVCHVACMSCVIRVYVVVRGARTWCMLQHECCMSHVRCMHVVFDAACVLYICRSRVVCLHGRLHGPRQRASAVGASDIHATYMHHHCNKNVAYTQHACSCTRNIHAACLQFSCDCRATVHGRLHSHDIRLGSGSKQQSVTAIDVVDDQNSLWLIEGLPCSHVDRTVAVFACRSHCCRVRM